MAADSLTEVRHPPEVRRRPMVHRMEPTRHVAGLQSELTTPFHCNRNQTENSNGSSDLKIGASIEKCQAPSDLTRRIGGDPVFAIHPKNRGAKTGQRPFDQNDRV